MTEIPEHLLARSRARREAAGLATPSEGGGAAAPATGAEVVRYEREVLSGLPPDPDLVAITEGTKPPLDKDGNPVAAG